MKRGFFGGMVSVFVALVPLGCSEAFSGATPSKRTVEAGVDAGHRRLDAGNGPTDSGTAAPDARRPSTDAAREASIAPPSEAGRDARATEPAIPLDGLLLWLRADRGVTEANGRVTIWADQSPHHSDALQTASNFRPVLVKDGIAGGPAIEFDGVDDYLSLPPGFSDFSQGVSLFAVVQAGPENACSAFMELSNGSEIDDISFGLFNGSLLYEVFDHDHSSGTFVYDAPQEVAVVHRPNLSLQIRRNGGSEGDDSFDLPAVVERTETFVGRTLYANCTTFSGRIAELLVYARAVSDRELLDIEAALDGRHGCCTN